MTVAPPKALCKPVSCSIRGIALFLLVLSLGGCVGGPAVLKPEQQVAIDRKLVEYPTGTELKPLITGLTAPTAIAFDTDGTLFIAEGGYNGRRPRIFGYKPDGTVIDIYPKGRQFPFNITADSFRVYGPVGGMVVANGKVFVTHRDENDGGMITAFNYDGTHKTIVAGLPAQGDFSVTDVAVNPTNGRLFFGVGAGTNSGVVGIDSMPWLRNRRQFCDRPWVAIYLLGRRFDTPNPFAGLFGGTDLAVTAPFQPFGKSIETHIPPAPDEKPNAAIYSVDQDGGGLRVEAHGIRYPMGLGFSENRLLYFTNQGMKHRGTRPVKNDPDVLCRWVSGQWYGWPDFSASLLPIREQRYQPEVNLIVKTGYRDLSFLIDHERSNLAQPNPSSNLLAGEFKPHSGAAKFAFAPSSGPFSRLRQAGNIALVALSGDHAPFDTVGLKLVSPIGYRIAQVNVDDRSVTDFIRNTSEGPTSRTDHHEALERPIDLKFGPDGALYILDFGEIDIRRGKEQAKGGTGRIFKLVATGEK